MNTTLSNFECNFFTILQAMSMPLHAIEMGNNHIICTSLCEKYNVLVALSGGSDSVAIVYLLHTLQKKYTGLNIACVYINHGLQEKSEQAREYAVVNTVCTRLGFELFSSNIEYSNMPHTSIEQTLRDERYKHIVNIAIQRNFNCIITAHHQDDVGETLLMRLFEGKAGKGLGSIPQHRLLHRTPPIYVIRPCIAHEKNRSISKNDLLYICNENNLPYHTDASNSNIDFRRNLIRNNILPHIQCHYPRVEKNIYATAMHLKEVYADVFCLPDYLQWMIEKKSHNTTAMLSMNRHIFDKQTPLIQKHILYTGLNQMGISDISESFLNECISDETNTKRGSRRFCIENIVIIKNKKTVLIIQGQTTQPSAKKSIAISEYLQQGNAHYEHIFSNSTDEDMVVYIRTEKKRASNCGGHHIGNRVGHGIEYIIHTYGNECIEYLQKNDTIMMNNQKINIVSHLMKYIHTQLWQDVLVLKDAYGIVMVMGESMLLPSLIRDALHDSHVESHTHTVLISYAKAYIIPHSL